jgi:hypothetical protein
MLQPLAQRRPLEQLHHRVCDAAAGADVVYGEDIGMRQRRDRLRFPLEWSQAGSRRERHAQRLLGEFEQIQV